MQSPIEQQQIIDYQDLSESIASLGDPGHSLVGEAITQIMQGNPVKKDSLKDILNVLAEYPYAAQEIITASFHAWPQCFEAPHEKKPYSYSTGRLEKLSERLATINAQKWQPVVDALKRDYVQQAFASAVTEKLPIIEKATRIKSYTACYGESIHVNTVTKKQLMELLEQGMYIHRKIDSYAFSLLHVARDAEITALLLDYGAHINDQRTSRDNETPLYHTIDTLHFYKPPLGLEKKTDSMSHDEQIRIKLIAKIKLLISRGANLDLANIDGRTPLDIALAEDREDLYEIALLLFKSGAHPILVKNKSKYLSNLNWKVWRNTQLPPLLQEIKDVLEKAQQEETAGAAPLS